MSVPNIGLMPPLLENVHATALLNDARNFGLGSCRTSESKSDSCISNGPADLRNSKGDTVACGLVRLVRTRV